VYYYLRTPMNRRQFFQTGASAALAQAVTAQSATFQTMARSRIGEGIKLGFDTYSVRAFNWKDIQLLDFAASLKADTVQISDSADYSSLDPAHLRDVKAHADRLGIRIDAGIGCICPLSKSWKPAGGPPDKVLVDGLRVAKVVGARSMRCFMGSMDDRRGDRPIEEFMDATIKVFKSVRAQAQDIGVKIALENHAGDMQAREVRTIIEESGRDFVASCLDTGNPMWVMEDPQVTLEVLGPYVVTSHVRDSVVFEHPRGAAAQWVALGDGVIDWNAFFTLYQKVCPQALLQLEIITGRPPQILPYFEKDWWKWFPKMPASEFARFTALAHKGHPFMGTMVIEDSPGSKPAEYTGALKEQQRQDLTRSLRYAQQELGLGLRWAHP
jgi:sugar phosphate isomerase/epimerase